MEGSRRPHDQLARFGTQTTHASTRGFEPSHRSFIVGVTGSSADTSGSGESFVVLPVDAPLGLGRRAKLLQPNALIRRRASCGAASSIPLPAASNAGGGLKRESTEELMRWCRRKKATGRVSIDDTGDVAGDVDRIGVAPRSRGPRKDNTDSTWVSLSSNRHWRRSINTASTDQPVDESLGSRRRASRPVKPSIERRGASASAPWRSPPRRRRERRVRERGERSIRRLRTNERKTAIINSRKEVPGEARDTRAAGRRREKHRHVPR